MFKGWEVFVAEKPILPDRYAMIVITYMQSVICMHRCNSQTVNILRMQNNVMFAYDVLSCAVV
jgi:hypothetical protein